MGNRYAFIVAYTDNYLPGMRALRNSINLYCPNIDIIEHHGISVEDTAIKRFHIAIEQDSNYDAICLLDADMFLTADPTLFFEVASKGFIVTGSNGMVINFNKAYQDQYQLDLGSDEYVYPKIHTTAPIFLNSKNIDWFEKFLEKRDYDHWDDFLYLNMVGIKMGKDKKMICMPPYSFTGIHHFQMKPATAVFERSGILMSGTEEQVFMIHGKYWDEGWLQDLMPTMEGYLRDENIGEKGRWRTVSAINLLKERFNRMLDGQGGILCYGK